MTNEKNEEGKVENVSQFLLCSGFLIHVTLYRDVNLISLPGGLGNCPVDPLAGLCCDKSAIKKDHCFDKRNTEITADKQTLTCFQ